MISSVWKRFLALPIWLKIIWILCVCGLILNTIALSRDIHNGAVLLRLHLGFFVLYAGQVVFILLGERLVWMLSLLQALLAFISNLDFTFVPVVRAVGAFVYALHGSFTVQELEIYKYVFVSACFSLEILKTVFIFLLIPAKSR